eukprot:scaffold1511_cov347-Prasinococcus_capsulatus_cf.AAC.2
METAIRVPTGEVLCVANEQFLDEFFEPVAISLQPECSTTLQPPPQPADSAQIILTINPVVLEAGGGDGSLVFTYVTSVALLGFQCFVVDAVGAPVDIIELEDGDAADANFQLGINGNFLFGTGLFNFLEPGEGELLTVKVDGALAGEQLCVADLVISAGELPDPFNNIISDPSVELECGADGNGGSPSPPVSFPPPAAPTPTPTPSPALAPPTLTPTAGSCIVPDCEDSVTYEGALGTCAAPVGPGACALDEEDIAACPVLCDACLPPFPDPEPEAPAQGAALVACSEGNTVSVYLLSLVPVAGFQFTMVCASNTEVGLAGLSVVQGIGTPQASKPAYPVQ